MKEIKPTTLWNVYISSTVDKSVDIESILKLKDTIEYKKYLLGIEKSFSKYKDNEVAAWQLSKKEEIRKQFFKTLKVTPKDNTKVISAELYIEFPEDWDKDFVLEWSRGFMHLSDMVTGVTCYTNGLVQFNLKQHLDTISLLAQDESFDIIKIFDK